MKVRILSGNQAGQVIETTDGPNLIATGFAVAVKEEEPPPGPEEKHVDKAKVKKR